MADSIFTKLAGPEIEGAATIFARKFKEAGVFTGGAGAGDGGGVMDPITRNKIKAEKDSIKILRQYIKAHEAVIKGDKTARAQRTIALRKLNKQQEILGDTYISVAKQFSSGKATQQQSWDKLRSLNVQYKRNRDGIKTFGESVNQAKKDVVSGSKEMVSSFMETAFSFRTAKFLVVKAAYQGFNDFKAAMKYGTDVTEGVWSNMSNAMSLGIDPARLSEIQASTRQAVSVMGGAAKWSKQVSAIQSSMFGHIGDLDTTTQFMADGMMTLVRAGIQPTTDAFMDASGNLGPLGKTFKDIQKISGATFEETGRMMKDLTEDQTIRWKLMGAASQKQRRIIIQETMERHKNLLAMGMNTEQAKRAAAALDQMAGKGPKERLKAAAKMQMMMGAMGIGGGAETAALMRKRVRTGPEDKKLAETMAKVNARVSETQQESLSGDFFASAMLQKSGMEGLLGPGSPFEKNLTEVASSGAETALNTKTMAEEYPKTTALVGSIQKWVTNLAVNPLLTGILAGVSFIGATVLQIRMAMGAGGIMDMFGKKGKGPGGMARVAGGMLKSVAKIGSVLAVAGGVVETFSETAKQTSENANKMGEAMFGKGMMSQITNNIVSGFRNIGDIASFGLADNLGELIGSSIAKLTGATYTDKSYTPQFAEVQSKLNAANANIENPQLKDIAALLMELKISNEQANKFSNTQVQTLAEIAADGKVSIDEQARMKREMRTKRGERGRSPRSL